MIGETIDAVVPRMRRIAAGGEYHYGTNPPEFLAPFTDSDGHLMNAARRLERAPQMHHLARRLCEAFYGSNARLVWAEPPFSAIGKQHQVWHYRLFCNPAWQPIMPRGEVYSTELTEKGWKSFSKLYGRNPDTVVDID